MQNQRVNTERKPSEQLTIDKNHESDANADVYHLLKNLTAVASKVVTLNEKAPRCLADRLVLLSFVFRGCEW